MIDKLEFDIEKRAEKAENLDFCKGIKLLNIKDKIAQMLNVIGSNEIFDQYTKHDISHINQMLRIAEWLIPDSTKELMTDAEWLMLTLAIYFHDLGMVVSKKEYEQRESNAKYIEFKKELLTNCTPEYSDFFKNEKNIYQEFVRNNHAVRIRSWLENKTPYRFGLAKEQQKILNDMFSNISEFEMFKNDLGMICESHHKDDIDDFGKYKIKSLYGNNDNSVVNLNYIAIILRITDLLHITNDRTPTIQRTLLDITNPISILEWEKQKAVKAICPKAKRDVDGNIDETIEKDTIEITAYFSGSETADAYFGLSSYLQYVRKELAMCNKISKDAKRREGSKYIFPWKNIDESNIKTEGFEAKKLSFTIEQDNILKLLVGHTLYNDSSVVVRELTQNAIDAVKLQKIIDDKNNKTNNGEVIIEWKESERILSFCDNGTGMTLSDIENYLLKVGASKYRQKEFEEAFKEFNPISRFGIGLLTCFMVANDVDIETSSEESEEVNYLCLRNVNGKYLLKKKTKEDSEHFIKEHGTIIRLHIRSDVDMSDVEENLRKWIVLTQIPVTLLINETRKKIGYTSLKEALIDYLLTVNIKVDNKRFKVEEKTVGNVTLACALEFNKYISDWSFLTTQHIRRNNKVNLTGTCVEGIRVEFFTPGFKGENLLSIANITGSKYQTNVARSALEYDENNEALKAIYDCYKLFIEDQINELQKLDYSQSWAIEEGKFIMNPLLGVNYTSNELIHSIDDSLLIKSLSEIKSVFVETNGTRNVVSVNDIINLKAFDIFDSKMIEAIEYLFKEIPSNSTVSEIINIVNHENRIVTENPLITNYNEFNPLHEYIFSKKQVSKIIVNTKTRRIQLTYEEKDNIWDSYKIESNHSITSINKLNLPKNHFKIEGLENEVGVKTIGGIYLNSETDLCKYLKNTVNLFDPNNSKDDIILLDRFLQFACNLIFTETLVEEKEFEYQMRRFEQRSSNLWYDDVFTKLWDKIDLSDFKNNILAKNHSIFSLDNWNRNEYY